MIEDYVRADQVLCKGCGKPLVKISKTGAHPTAVYKELLMEFDDGSRHISPLCDGCAGSADVSVAKEYYRVDLKQWQKEANQAKTKLPQQWFTRTVTSVRVNE